MKNSKCRTASLAAGLFLALNLLAGSSGALATEQSRQRQAGREVKQDTPQESRETKVDCRQENQKSNAACRQDKRETKQGGRQEARDIKY